jgi:outer membrane protein assembly factor BamB
MSNKKDLNRRQFVGGVASAAAIMITSPQDAVGRKKRYATHKVSLSSVYKRGKPSESVGGALNLPDFTGQTASTSPDAMMMFRGDPAHRLYGVGSRPKKLEVLWKHRMIDFKTKLRGRDIVWRGTGWTGQAIAIGDYVFVGSVGRSFYAFEADSGRLRWRLEAGRMIKSSPCYYRGMIYVGSVDNLVRAIDARTGHVKWAVQTGNDCDSSPCVVNDRLYFCGESGHARCLDPATGNVHWETFLGGVGPKTKPGSNGLETSPAIDNGELYAASYDGDLFCLDTEKGRVKWTANTLDDTDASPVLSDEFVYAASEEKASHVFCFDRQNKGKEVWRFSKNRYGYWSTPALFGETLYIGGQNNVMYALNARTGIVQWTFKAKAAIWSSPAVVEDVVIFGSYDAHVYMVDAKTGQLIQSIRLDGRVISTPIVYRGKIYVGTATGTFYCIG